MGLIDLTAKVFGSSIPITSGCFDRSYRIIDTLVVNKFNNSFCHDYILISVFFLAASIMQYKEDTLDFIESFLGNLSI